MVIRELIQETVSKLKDNNIENAVFEAHLIVRTVLKMKPIDMVLSYNKKPDEQNIEIVRDFAERRCLNEPLQYILGVQEFMGLEFSVNKNVLIPRMDTETLVEAVLSEKKGMNVLDICAGSGCIGLSIAHYNKNAFVLGVDISEKALETANINTVKLGLTERVKFQKMDIMTEMPDGVFDIIASNPPYINHDLIETLQQEVKHEAHIALDGGTDGLDFYRRIIKIAPKLLQEEGKLYFEVGYDQAEKVQEMMKNNFTEIKIIKDLCGINRVVCGKRKK